MARKLQHRSKAMPAYTELPSVPGSEWLNPCVRPLGRPRTSSKTAAPIDGILHSGSPRESPRPTRKRKRQRLAGRLFPELPREQWVVPPSPIHSRDRSESSSTRLPCPSLAVPSAPPDKAVHTLLQRPQRGTPTHSHPCSPRTTHVEDATSEVLPRYRFSAQARRPAPSSHSTFACVP